MPGDDRHGMFGVKLAGSQHWRLCIPCELENPVNVVPSQFGM